MVEELSYAPTDPRRLVIQQARMLVEAKRVELAYGRERSRLLGITIDEKVLSGTIGFLGTAILSAVSTF